ncbi:uncharacterized protein METZ01_LOCUS109693 [marine metagenome]|uniref:Uncharacterized protein n=1 Tax=marine metagenome TaxID=408172 RepID=A0A381WWC2_9ZZZZ
MRPFASDLHSYVPIRLTALIFMDVNIL